MFSLHVVIMFIFLNKFLTKNKYIKFVFFKNQIKYTEIVKRLGVENPVIIGSSVVLTENKKIKKQKNNNNNNNNNNRIKRPIKRHSVLIEGSLKIAKKKLERIKMSKIKKSNSFDVISEFIREEILRKQI